MWVDLEGDDLPVRRRQCACEVERRHADRGTDLDDPAGAAAKREDVQQLTGLMHDDRDALPGRMRLHLGKHVVRLGSQRVQIRADGFGDDHSRGTIPVRSSDLDTGSLVTIHSRTMEG